MLDVAGGMCDLEQPASSQVKLVPLNQLKKGDVGIIVRINSRGALRQRLLDMGVVIGEEICLKHKALFSDPLEFTLKDYQISLHKEEAAEIMVEVALCN